jgi:CHAT domain-containing protein
VHDLSGFRLPGSTVVLTACSSGRGVAPAGDEWIGLARGFLQAGASTVVASLWPIEDASTVELVHLFYREFAAGQGAAAALGRAMRAMIPRRPHPWRWAPFAVLGGVGS